MDPDIHADARLHDHAAMAEIELYADVLIAVAGADSALSTAELDRVLGVVRPRRPARVRSGGAPSLGRFEPTERFDAAGRRP
ncbi:hypothetical protein [Nocardiopsis coralliicola]